jgi:exosortase H (IPTLxxWG-CTERM-specific)
MKTKRANPNKTKGGNSTPGGMEALRRWYAGKAPLLHFGAKFCALTVLFYLILLLPVCKRVISAVTVCDARLSGLLLNLLGQHNHVDGATLWQGGRSVISVVPSCSGFDFLCFFCAAVLVFPVPFARKLAGMLIGIPQLLALNLVRIMSLYFIGVHYPGVFDIVHEEIWAVILIAASIVLYIAWMRWAGPANRHPLDATA